MDAFLDANVSVLPSLKLDYKIINKLLEAHKTSREKELFPNILDQEGVRKIKIEFQGTKKDNIHLKGSSLEDLINKLRLVASHPFLSTYLTPNPIKF